MSQNVRPAGRRAAVLVIAALAVSLASPVLAACYDLLGCTNSADFSRHYSDYLASPNGPTCDFLYQMRNQIYADHGYCFATARGIAEIGNQGCSIHNQSQVPLSNVERNNVAVILRAENARGCSI
jgi:hypothetical protein